MSRDFTRSQTRKARIEHRCSESGCVRTGTILPGTRYVVVSGVFDGHHWSEKLCLRCQRAHHRVHAVFGPLYGESGPAIGELLDWLRERPESKTQRARSEAKLHARVAAAERARRMAGLARVAGAVAAVACAKEADLVALEEASGHRFCRRCECCDLDWQDCHECGGDGFWEDDSDPLWGVEDRDCSLCETLGGWWMCGGRCDAQGMHAERAVAT